MLVAAWLGAVLTTAGPPCSVKAVDVVEISERTVRIGDVVDLACVMVADRDQLIDLEIATLPPATNGAELTQGGIRSLVERRVPGLKLAKTNDDERLVEIVSKAAQPARPSMICQRTRRDLSAGQVVVKDDLETAPCVAALTPQPFTFDRIHQLVRTTRPVAQDELVTKVSFPSKAYDVGDALSLVVHIGPVQIERRVEAIQPSVDDARIFVSDAEGAIFSVPTRSTKGARQ